MTKKSKITEPTQAEQNVGELLSKTDRFIENHLKKIILAVVAIIILVTLFITSRHFYFEPMEKDAQEAIFPGERYLASQQWDLALNGDTLNYSGFLQIVDDYGYTKTGNLAKAYSGICYYHLGDYESAINYLKQYKGKEKIVTSTCIGLTGDCYAQLEETGKAIDYFNKAADKADNLSLSPIYLKKAAVAYESLGNYKDALTAYNKIKTKYPESQEAAGIDKYIEKAKELIK
jgi:tetratricopeptide (TPR) repeat protein